MNSPAARKYYSKIILFGEYGILLGSPALTAPFRQFSGKLIIPGQELIKRSLSVRSNSVLRNLYEYLHNSCKVELSEYHFQFDRLDQDLQKGMHFLSDIPNGYGVGSSGALTAAIFDSYSDWNREANQLSGIKSVLGKMESFFHQRSSGMDPLTSLVDRPILIGGNGQISIIPFEVFSSDLGIYLVDSGKKGKTGDYVSNFLQQSQNPDYMVTVIEPYIELIKKCINNFLDNEVDSLFLNLRLLSEHQYKNFPELIPEHIRKIWMYGIDSDTFYLKLCGSGGGGFTLAFLRDKGFDLTEYLNRESLESIHFTT